MTKNRLWNFYINKTKSQVSGNVVVATYACIKPEKIKIWKELQKRLQNEIEIESVSYEAI